MTAVIVALLIMAFVLFGLGLTIAAIKWMLVLALLLALASAALYLLKRA